MILSRKVSRLTRTDKDWVRLMEVCQLFGTLIADTEQIYDLSLVADQLALGIKGTLSIVELSALRLRIKAGMAEKARRGEFFNLLPPGYVAQRGILPRKPIKRPTTHASQRVEPPAERTSGTGTRRPGDPGRSVAP